jgi:hypothetical protein
MLGRGGFLKAGVGARGDELGGSTPRVPASGSKERGKEGAGSGCRAQRGVNASRERTFGAWYWKESRGRVVANFLLVHRHASAIGARGQRGNGGEGTSRAE